jgi:hypothetical protein
MKKVLTKTFLDESSAKNVKINNCRLEKSLYCLLKGKQNATIIAVNNPNRKQEAG